MQKFFLALLFACSVLGTANADPPKAKSTKPQTLRPAAPQQLVCISRKAVYVEAQKNLTYKEKFLFGPFRVFAVDKPAWGLHYNRGTHHLIKLEADMETDTWLARIVSAHELGHAIGLDHGTPADSAWMLTRFPRNPLPIYWPHPEEQRKAIFLTQKKRFMVYIEMSEYPGLHRAVRWACETWNSAIGEDIFAIADNKKSTSK